MREQHNVFGIDLARMRYALTDAVDDAADAILVHALLRGPACAPIAGYALIGEAAKWPTFGPKSLASLIICVCQHSIAFLSARTHGPESAPLVQLNLLIKSGVVIMAHGRWLCTPA